MLIETTGDTDLSAIGALLAEPARCAVLLALADGRRLPASMLASEAGVAASTMSGHLKHLVNGGLVNVYTHGRHRYYQVTGPEVGRLIEAVAQLSPRQPVRSLRQGTKAFRLRLARRCYDHMGGRLAVAITQSLLDSNTLTGNDTNPVFSDERRPSGGVNDGTTFTLTPEWIELLNASIGTAIDASNPVPVSCCVDWTEQRHHISGSFGSILLARLTALGWVQQSQCDRSLCITEDGSHQLVSMFGIDQELVSVNDCN